MLMLILKIILSFLGKVFLKIGFGKFICFCLKSAWFEKIIERCFESKGRTIIMIAELEKKFEDLKKENWQLKENYQNLNKKMDEIIAAVVPKKSKSLTTKSIVKSRKSKLLTKSRKSK